MNDFVKAATKQRIKDLSERIHAECLLEKSITLDCEPEADIPYVGNCCAIGPKEDLETEEWIRKELASGNEWAWCTVRVSVTWGGYTEDTYLGGCSYKSRQDFIDSGELESMASECAYQLADRLITQYQKLTVLVGAR